MLDQAESQQTGPAESIFQISCADFRHNPDGSWTALRQIDLVGPNGPQRLIPEGRVFTRGQMFMFGLDVAAVLDQQCGG